MAEVRIGALKAERDGLRDVLVSIRTLVGEPYSYKMAHRGLNGWVPGKGFNPRDFDYSYPYDPKDT